MIEPRVQWTTAAPLWSAAANAAGQADRRALRQPALLRFASDTFMDDFMAMLEHEPARLAELRARPETWRQPAPMPQPVKKLPAFARALNRSQLAATHPTAQAASVPATLAAPAASPPVRPLKLFQPAHQRFYMVTACLVCRIPGLPDRTLDTNSQERVGYVLRRLRDRSGRNTAVCNPDTCDEFALVNTGGRSVWKKVADAGTDAGEQLAEGEEQLPMFAVNYVDAGRRRRIFAGLVPTGNREALVAAPYDTPAAGAAAPTLTPGKPALLAQLPQPPDPRVVLLLGQVVQPWLKLIELADRTNTTLRLEGVKDGDKPSPALQQQLATDARDQIQMLSWLILLDLAEFVEKYLNNLWQVIINQRAESALSADERSLFNALTGMTYTRSGATRTLRQALADIGPFADALEQAPQVYTTRDPSVPATSPPWPNFLFPLAWVPMPSLVPVPESLSGQLQPALERLVAAALPNDPAPDAPPLPLAAQPVPPPSGPEWFMIRCVFDRPDCGPLVPATVSAPSVPFQIAGFFDPDAPARPIRIALPIDTSPAGLRKFDKNTAFMISDMLCGQIDRMGKLSLGDLVLSVLPWPFHKDLPAGDGGPCTDDSGGSLGMICSLSIPIITICALILLMIIITLFDIIFHWIPFFLLCFPLPGRAAKER